MAMFLSTAPTDLTQGIVIAIVAVLAVVAVLLTAKAWAR